MSGPGRLYVVGTPIGNLEDISPRAVRILGSVRAIYCEDTRRTRKLLSALEVAAPRLARLDRHTEAAMVAPVVRLLSEGADAALVSDAGMPTISDPGADLVKGVAAAGLGIEVVPGPCAISAALALSGFPASQYRFAGFLARRGSQRSAALASIGRDAVSTVVYEAPGRVAATVADLAAACGAERPVALVRELTKLHEEVWRGTLQDALQWLAGGDPRGEWVIVVGPRPPEAAAEVADHDVASALSERLVAGTDRRTAIAEVAEQMSLPRRRVYAVAVALKQAGGPKEGGGGA